MPVRFIILSIIFLVNLQLSLAQDLTGRWVAITGTTSGYYAELYLIKNIGDSYAGHSYDTENGGYCRHWMNGDFNTERKFLSGIDVELINKSPDHEATDYQLRYEKGENGREYLIGTATITPLNSRQNLENMSAFERLGYQMMLRATPPNFVKYVKVSDDYQLFDESMPLAMTPHEIMLEKAAFDEVYEEDLKLDEERISHQEDLQDFEIYEIPASKESEITTRNEEDILHEPQIPSQPDVPSSKEILEPSKMAQSEESVSILKDEPTIVEKKASRSNQLLSHIRLETRKVTLLIRDYGTVDNDTVTIFFNDRIVAENLRIDAVADEFELELEPGKQNELVFVANNLGDVPPNTARITLIADNRRYNYKLFTDEKNNALVLLEDISR